MLQGQDRGAPPAEASTTATRSSMGGDLESSLRRRAPPPPRASAGGPLAGTQPLSPRTWAGLCRAACAAASSAGPRGLRIAQRRSVERIVSEVRFLGGLRSSTPRRGRVIREPARTEQHRVPRAAGRRSRSPVQACPGPRATATTRATTTDHKRCQLPDANLSKSWKHAPGLTPPAPAVCRSPRLSSCRSARPGAFSMPGTMSSWNTSSPERIHGATRAW